MHHTGRSVASRARATSRATQISEHFGSSLTINTYCNAQNTILYLSKMDEPSCYTLQCKKEIARIQTGYFIEYVRVKLIAFSYSVTAHIDLSRNHTREIRTQIHATRTNLERSVDQVPSQKSLLLSGWT